DQRHSVAKRYFTSEDTKRRYHCVIAEYFEDLLSSPSTWQVLYKPNIKSDAIGTYDIVRISDELPYHLIEAEHWYRLKKSVCSMPVFLSLCSKDRKYELTKCWILMEKKYYNAGDSYEEAIEELNEVKL